VFAGTSDTAGFLASSDDGNCPPAAPDGEICADSTLTLAMGPGHYTLVVAAFDNMSLAENLGNGSLGDGFVGLGNFDPARSADFAVDISGTGLDSLFRDSFE